VSRRVRRAAALLAAIALAGCSANPAPRGWLPQAEELPHETRGGWIVVRTRSGVHRAGELIAVSATKVHVLTRSGLEEVPLTDVRGASLALYEPRRVGAGALIVLTHGFFAVLTAPMWLAVASAASREHVVEVSGAELPIVARYARFPQGLPPGVGTEDLGPLWFRDPRSGKDTSR
jgi:hypothetical protein